MPVIFSNVFGRFLTALIGATVILSVIAVHSSGGATARAAHDSIVLGGILRGDPGSLAGWRERAPEELTPRDEPDERPSPSPLEAEETRLFKPLDDEDEPPVDPVDPADLIDDPPPPITPSLDDIGGVKRTDGGPHGSVSIGYPAGGSLRNAYELPLSGPNHAFLPHVGQRRTNFGTDEVHQVLTRAGAAVAESFPGSTIIVGNISFRGGGQIPWSISHRAGRDFDLAFFVDDEAGRPLEVARFEHFDDRGVSRAHRDRFFSLPRNWALVQALVMDELAPVQRIFVSSGLRELLLQHARDIAAPEEAVLRAEKILLQPTMAAPHSDHFHVRLFCSLHDSLEGCHDYHPRWDWVPDPRPFVLARIRALVHELNSPEHETRVAAIELLQRLEADNAISQVSRRLEDNHPRVRAAALAFLRSRGQTTAYNAITRALPRIPDLDFATRLINTLARSYSGDHAPLLERILTNPGAALPRFASDSVAHPRLRAAAADALRTAGRPQSIRPLIDALMEAEPQVRVAAAGALPYLTNHNLPGQWGRGLTRSQAQRQQRSWQRFYLDNRHHSWEQVIRLGFARRGIRFRGKMMSPPAVPVLIRALSRGGYLQHNAVRILRQLVGAAPVARCDVRPDCWVRWWRSAFREHGLRRPGI